MEGVNPIRNPWLVRPLESTERTSGLEAVGENGHGQVPSAQAVEEAGQTLGRIIGEGNEHSRCRGVLCVGRDNQHQMVQAPSFVLNTPFFICKCAAFGWIYPTFLAQVSATVKISCCLLHTHSAYLGYFVLVPSSPRSSLPQPRSTISCVKGFHAHPMFPGLPYTSSFSKHR